MNKNVFKQQYKRNQIEEGYKYFMVCEEFGSKVNAVGNPSDKFLLHFKRLLNLDRKEYIEKGKYIFSKMKGKALAKKLNLVVFICF